MVLPFLANYFSNSILFCHFHFIFNFYFRSSSDLRWKKQHAKTAMTPIEWTLKQIAHGKILFLALLFILFLSFIDHKYQQLQKYILISNANEKKTEKEREKCIAVVVNGTVISTWNAFKLKTLNLSTSKRKSEKWMTARFFCVSFCFLFLFFSSIPFANAWTLNTVLFNNKKYRSKTHDKITSSVIV